MDSPDCKTQSSELGYTEATDELCDFTVDFDCTVKVSIAVGATPDLQFYNGTTEIKLATLAANTMANVEFRVKKGTRVRLRLSANDTIRHFCVQEMNAN